MLVLSEQVGDKLRNVADDEDSSGQCNARLRVEVFHGLGYVVRVGCDHSRLSARVALMYRWPGANPTAPVPQNAQEGIMSVSNDDRVPLTSLWRQEALSRVEELRSLLPWFAAQCPDGRKELLDAVESHLRKGEAATQQTGGLRGWLSGAAVQRAESSLDAAEVNLLRVAPLEYLQSNMPALVVEATDVLPPKDPRLVRLVQLADSSADGLREVERSTVVAAIDAAKKGSLRAQAQLRSFRNVVLVATLLAATLAAGVAVVGLLAPDTLPLCYRPAETDDPVCPASGSPRPADSLLIEFTGILGAAVAAVFALRKVRGSPDPYSVSVALAILKLPTGALTAFLGLMLISAGFVPGLSALDSSAQILSWAVILGYSQELFTRLVDRQAHVVLAQSHFDTTASPALRNPVVGASTLARTG